MNSKFIVVISLVVLALLIVLAIISSVPEIEDDLFERSKKALIEEGIEFDNIRFSGQEAILTGIIGSQVEKDHIERIVSAVLGVVGVSNYLIIQTTLAVIIRAKGETRITNSMSGKSSNAESGTRLIDGDIINTGIGGRVELKFLDDNSLLRIRPNSTCTVAAKEEKNTVAKNIFVEVGSIFSRIIQQKSSFKVTTSTSVAAVKGTSFWTIQEFKGPTSFLAEEGVVEISNDAGVVLLNAGEMCNVSSKSSKLIVEKIDLTKTFLNIVGDSKISFDQSGSSLDQQHYNFLNRVKEFMDKYPIALLEINGYTDAIGKSNANLILSEKRANAVKEYLIKSGVDPESLYANGFGEKNPIASNYTKAGRRKNRRVEFKIKENK